MADTDIYLDMDGVCVDLISALLASQGYDAGEVLARWRAEHPGSHFPRSLLGKTEEQFFRHKDMYQKSFWQGLEPYPWFETLYAELGKRGHVVFLSAPPADMPDCVSGKQEWLIEQFGSGFNDFIFTSHKYKLAHSKAVLVDDLPFNTKRFERRNGHGLIFPQAWNEHHHVDDPLGHLLEALDRTLSAT